ncbi:MAG: zinc ribbon domain-containing protein [Candidatus Nanopelagicales bacterium]|nr:zinc ribbon domain-containing protein [Candidatus Nanopelagicales bacterium]
MSNENLDSDALQNPRRRNQKYCSHCGAQVVVGDAAFCSACGNPTNIPAALRPYAPHTNQNAIIAFVLALLSWFICPVVPAIVALFVVNRAEVEIEESGGGQVGKSLTIAADWIAWINILLWMVLVAAGVAIAWLSNVK